MSTTIQRCKHYAKPFTGPSALKDVADNLVKKDTTVVAFHAAMDQLSIHKFDLWTGGPAKIPPLCQAAASNNVTVIQYILTQGDDSLLSFGDYMGRIPLFVAVHYHALEALRKLIEYGSPINTTHTSIFMQFQATPLLMAMKMQDLEMTKLLRKHGGKCAHPLDKVDAHFLTKVDNELAKDKENLTTELDNATGSQFSMTTLDLIADYA